MILFLYCSDEIRNEIKALKKDYRSDKKSREIKDEPVKTQEKEHDNEMVQSYLSEQRKYSNLKKDIPKKGAERWDFQMKFLQYGEEKKHWQNWRDFETFEIW